MKAAGFPAALSISVRNDLEKLAFQNGTSTKTKNFIRNFNSVVQLAILIVDSLNCCGPGRRCPLGYLIHTCSDIDPALSVYIF
jgi:hypothetical protein